MGRSLDMGVSQCRYDPPYNLAINNESRPSYQTKATGYSVDSEKNKDRHSESPASIATTERGSTPNADRPAMLCIV